MVEFLAHRHVILHTHTHKHTHTYIYTNTHTHIRTHRERKQQRERERERGTLTYHPEGCSVASQNLATWPPAWSGRLPLSTSWGCHIPMCTHRCSTDPAVRCCHPPPCGPAISRASWLPRWGCTCGRRATLHQTPMIGENHTGCPDSHTTVADEGTIPGSPVRNWMSFRKFPRRRFVSQYKRVSSRNAVNQHQQELEGEIDHRSEKAVCGSVCHLWLFAPPQSVGSQTLQQSLRPRH